MFTMRVFVPTLGSSQIDTKVNKRIKVMRQRRLPEGVDKSVQTVVGLGRADRNEQAEGAGDEGGCDGSSLLLPEVIEYMVKIETLET
jgi:hypothetical protein